MLQLNGTIDVLTIDRQGPDDYVVTASEEILAVKNIPNHDDDGSPNAGNNREATGLTVVGTASNPVIYATSSDSRVLEAPVATRTSTPTPESSPASAWQGTDIDDPLGF